MITEEFGGSYELTVNLIDSRGKESKENMDLIVTCGDLEKELLIEELLIEKQLKEERESNLITKPRIYSYNGYGEIYIVFDQDIEI